MTEHDAHHHPRAGSRADRRGADPVDRRLLVRTVVAAVAAVVPLATLVVVAATVAPGVGPRLASHWSLGSGRPDGFSGTWSSAAVLGGIGVVITAVAVALVVRGRSGARARQLAGALAGLAGIESTAWVVTVLATASAPSPEEATTGWWPALVALGAAWGVVVGLLATGTGTRPGLVVDPTTDAGDLDDAGSASSTDPAPLRDGERLAWSGSTGSPVFVVLGAVIVATGVALAVVSGAGDGVGLATSALSTVVGVMVVALGRVRLTVDRRGVRLVSSLLRVPLLRVALDDVRSAAAETVDPMSWGGWGWRFSRRGRAYVSRRGPGLVVVRTDGRAAVVTIDDAAGAAAATRALLGR